MANPKNKWDQPSAPPAPMFFGKKERDLVKQVNDELSERIIGQPIAYYPISIEDSNFNDTYGEAIEKVSLPPVRLYAYVVVEDEQSNERYGYEYQTKLTVNFSRKRLVADQDLYVRVGDFVQYGEYFYEIVKTYNDTRYYFGQVEHKFQISAECIRARSGNFRVIPAVTRPTDTPTIGGSAGTPPPRAAPYPPLTATYITVTAASKLPNERILTAGSGITITDAGAGGALTLAATGQNAIGPTGSLQLTTGAGGFSGSANLLFLTSSDTIALTGAVEVVGTMSASSTISAKTLSASLMNLQPTSGSLAGGASYLGLNTSNNLILTAAATTATSPGGATTQIQYNNAGAFGGSSNLTFNGTTLTGSYTGSLAEFSTLSASAFQVLGNTVLGDASGDSVTITAQTIVLTNIAAGTDNTVLVYDGSSIVTDEIDSRVWGSTLVDASGTPVDNQVGIWTDANTMEGDAGLTYNSTSNLLALTGTMAVSSSGDQQLFRVDGATAGNVLFVTGSGRVGIGTDSPSDALHISATDAALRIQKSDETNAHGDLVMGANGLYLYSRADTADGIFSFNGFGGASATEFMRINGVGNVGIGTSTPGALLEVSSSGDQQLFRVDGATAGSTLFVTGSGRVGIGTTSPGRTLTVEGEISASSALYGTDLVLETSAADTIATIYIRGTSGTEIIGQSGGAMNVRSDGGSLNLLGGTGNELHFGTDNTDSRMVMDTDGNVGIGTGTPTSTLHVVGDVTASIGLSGSVLQATHLTASYLTASYMNLQPTSGTLAGAGSYLGLDANNNVILSAGDGSTTSPAAPVNSIQFNDASSFGGSSNLTYNSSTSFMALSGAMAVSSSGDQQLFRVDGATAGNVLFVTGSGRVGIGTTTPTHPLTVVGASYLSGALVHKRTAVTNDYSVALTDYYLGVDTTSNTVDLTLPAASTAVEGQTYVVKDEGGNAAANAITVLRSASDTIDGNTSVALDVPYSALSLYTDGANWFIY